MTDSILAKAIAHAFGHLGLPRMALSVRQPWAWAIMHAGKDIENRTARAVTLGRMTTGRVAIHAAKGMTRDEYEAARTFILRVAGDCPRPDDLTRGAVIGTVTVTRIERRHSSPWFFGPRGLVLADPAPIEPIPAAGQLGYFEWEPRGLIEQPLAWMRNWPGRNSQRQSAANDQMDMLFGALMEGEG